MRQLWKRIILHSATRQLPFKWALETERVVTKLKSLIWIWWWKIFNICGNETILFWKVEETTTTPLACKSLFADDHQYNYIVCIYIAIHFILGSFQWRSNNQAETGEEEEEGENEEENMQGDGRWEEKEE